jgi:hypothetical protein
VIAWLKGQASQDPRVIPNVHTLPISNTPYHPLFHKFKAFQNTSPGVRNSPMGPCL